MMSKKKIIISIAVLLMTVGTVYAETACSGGSGNIWALHDDNDDDSDKFLPGENVWLSGQHFELDTTYSWDITNQYAEGKVKPAVAKGEVTTDEGGNIPPILIWTIPGDAYAESYRINLRYNNCTKPIFTKKDSFETIPEYPTVMIPAIMSLGGYMALRIKRRKLG